MVNENQKDGSTPAETPPPSAVAPDDPPFRGGRSSFARLAGAAGLAAVLVAADQWTKIVAERELAGRGALRLVGDLAILVFTWNSGAFLSLGSALPPIPRRILLLLVPAMILAALGVILAKRARSRRIGGGELAAAALLVAGGVGNLVDRAIFGAVRDFLNFGLGRLRTGIMNLADLYILGALVILLVSTAREDRRRRRAETKSED